MLDDLGGTDIVAVRPRDVLLIRGLEKLACMSLSPTGTLRWYTSCCRTAIGNTPRDYRQSHVGLIHSGLELGEPSLEESFGPVQMRVHVKDAKGKPGRNAPIGFVLAVLRYLGSLTSSRVSGKYRINPFMSGSDGKPRVEPRVLSLSERAALYDAVQSIGTQPVFERQES